MAIHCFVVQAHLTEINHLFFGVQIGGKMKVTVDFEPVCNRGYENRYYYYYRTGKGDFECSALLHDFL